MIVTRTHRIAAALIALVYVAVQAFQWHVFGALPETSTAAEALLQGMHPLNLARAIAMLLSIFSLVFLFGVCCALAYQRRALEASAAFAGFFVFFLLEICLRSVELFHVYLALPGQFQAATDAASQATVLAQAATFASIQHALYFPLGLSWMLGSLLLCVALGQYRIDRLARFAFGLNALRLALRMLDAYAFPPVTRCAVRHALPAAGGDHLRAHRNLGLAPAGKLIRLSGSIAVASITQTRAPPPPRRRDARRPGRRRPASMR